MARVGPPIALAVQYSLLAVAFLAIFHRPCVGFSSGVCGGRYAGIMSPTRGKMNHTASFGLWHAELSSVTMILPYLWRRWPGRPVGM